MYENIFFPFQIDDFICPFLHFRSYKQCSQPGIEVKYIFCNFTFIKQYFAIKKKMLF